MRNASAAHLITVPGRIYRRAEDGRFARDVPHSVGFTSRLQSLEGRGLSEPPRLGKVGPEPIASALIFAGHLGRGMAEMLLHVALLDVGRRGKAGAQRVP